MTLARRQRLPPTIASAGPIFWPAAGAVNLLNLSLLVRHASGAAGAQRRARRARQLCAAARLLHARGASARQWLGLPCSPLSANRSDIAARERLSDSPDTARDCKTAPKRAACWCVKRCGIELSGALARYTHRCAVIDDENSQIRDRTGGSPPAVSRSAASFSTSIPQFSQHRRMVRGHPCRRAAAQGPALLPSARRKFGNRIHRLCLGAEPARGSVGRAGPPPADHASCSTRRPDGRYEPKGQRACIERCQIGMVLTKKAGQCPAFFNSLKARLISCRPSPCPALP